MLTLKQKRNLVLQRYLSYAGSLLIGPIINIFLRYFFCYKCKNESLLKEKMKKIIYENENKPIIICSNHLTMIDSLLLIIFLFDMKEMLINFRLFPWNIPEIKNVRTNVFYTLICFLSKCLFIDRKGSKEKKDLILDKIEYLLEKRELICIFPEGRRSRSGYIEIEKAVYGVGSILSRVPDCPVVCVYLRGENQLTYSNYPSFSDSFYIDIDKINPISEKNSIRKDRELTFQIMDKLKQMEESYFANR